MQRVLVTGSTGRIGQAFVTAYQDRYEFVWADLKEPARPIVGPHQFTQADFSDANAARALCQGIGTVVHLAGVPDPNAEFDAVLPSNILATTYLIDAAKKPGVAVSFTPAVRKPSKAIQSTTKSFRGWRSRRPISMAFPNTTARPCVRSMRHSTACPAFHSGLGRSSLPTALHSKPNAT